jgi:carbonic anhydrase
MAVGTLQLHGWYYDIASGGIDAYHPDLGRFIPLAADHKQAGSA